MLELVGVDAWYGDAHILHDIRLRVGDGERAALLGRNGAGKSTLLKSIMNAQPRTAGRIMWNGNPLGAMPPFRRARLGLALVPEDRRIFTHVTVRENIEMARYATDAHRPAPAADDILARFPMLGPLATRLGGRLSGGQQQMLAVARAVAAHPRLMLLDEPTEGLAPVIVEQLAGLVKAECDADRCGLLLAEQNVWFARQCTQRVYVLDTGRIVFSGDWNSFDKAGDAVRRHLAI